MNPLISIITVTYNPGIERLKKTFESVKHQTIRNQIEYLIIDGKSTDSTIVWINNHKHDIDFYISEPDSGIYDAMNKGVRSSNGEWVLFLNAGDQIYSQKTMEHIKEFLINNEPDIIYGDCIQAYDDYDVYDKASPLSRLPFQMIASHQSILCKRQLLIEYPFNLNYKICADFNFICKVFNENKIFYYYNAPISIVEPVGFSSANFKKNLLEKRNIVLTYFSSKRLLLYFYYTVRIIIFPFISFLKRILPHKLLFSIRKRKYHNAQRKNASA